MGNAAPSGPSTPPPAPAAVALPSPADAPAPGAESEAPAPASTSRCGVGADTMAARIFQSNLIALNEYLDKNADIVSEEQRASLVRDYAKMSGLDHGAEK